jgi:hypothetical protein
MLAGKVGAVGAVGTKKKKRRKKVKATGEKALKHTRDRGVMVGLQEFRTSDSRTLKFENQMRPKKV